jgi:hypothetical protein
MASYLEISDENFSLQLSNFASKVDTYQNTFGFTDAEIASIKDDATYLQWIIGNILKITTHKKNWTAIKKMARKGTSNNATNTIFEFPEIEKQPVFVANGIEFRFRTMVRRIKAHQNYTTAIGQNLGIEMTPVPKIDLDEAKPILKAVTRAGKVNLDWKKGQYDGIYIEKDSGLGFVALDKDLRPNFIDESPMPPQGQSAVWKYRAMYLYQGEKVGLWSDIVTATVAL